MIYCVEDERNIRELIVYTLESAGFAAKGFPDGEAFSSELAKQLPELVLLDLMMPGEDGLTILKKLRADSRTERIPVILVTAKSSEYDKVLGLDAGADDYIAKPFGMMELIARVKALLRRSGETPEKTEKKEYIRGRLTLNVEQHQVRIDGEEVPLTLKEFELLKYLLENSGIVLSRDRLLEHIWGYDFNGETRTVDVHIRTLRKKLGDCQEMIETVRGVGYRIGGF